MKMKIATKKARREARQVVASGAREATAGYDGRLNGTVGYLRTSRGIVRTLRGPDGQNFGDRLVPDPKE